MHRFVLVLVGLIILAIACGGGTDDNAAPDAEAPDEGAAPDLILDALETGLQPALLRDIPLLVEEQASCISESILAGLPGFETALEDPESFAEEMLADIRAAQESCLTPERLAELETDETVVLARDPAEEALLLLARGVAGGLDAEDQDLVEAGYLMCAFAEEAGSLDVLLARFTATPEASAKLAADLLPLVGKVLRDEELILFATTAVVALCPEDSERQS